MPPKRFVFRLQTVLDIKLKKEDEEKKKFGELVRILREQEQILENWKAMERQTRLELKQKLAAGKGLDINELQRYNSFLKKLEKDIERQTVRVREWEEAVERQRVVMLEAMKERKILEELRQQHLDAFNFEIEEEEKKLIDELATLKYARDMTNREDEE